MCGLVCQNEWCGEEHYQCQKCKKVLNGSDTYEYRGALSCLEHSQEVMELREFKRQEIIEEENNKTKKFIGITLDDSSIGKANKEIMKSSLQIAAKESGRIKDYEGRL